MIPIKNKLNNMKHLKNFEEYYNNDKTVLDIRDKTLNTFPQEYLPLHKSLQILHCIDNYLTSLPELPNSLQILWCHSNNLISLPELPKNLQKLNCYSNYLSILPKLPNSLQTLSCSFNNLTSLPKLPNSLQELYCRGNKLTSLPELPKSLQIFNFSGNAWENPVPYDIFNKNEKFYEIQTFYTREQQEKFKSYEYQKKFMEDTPFEWKDLDVSEIGIHPKIRDEFDFIFEYNSYKL